MTIVPNVREFRRKVNKIKDKRDSNVIKSYYLTASRASELVTSMSQSDLKFTKPYGVHLRWSLDEYEEEKALVLNMAVLKRKKKEVMFKTIGLPCNPKYEPWTLDLLKRIKEKNTIAFDLNRQRIRQIIMKYFPYPEMESKKYNWLRHIRLTHLMEFYGLKGDHIIMYAGWSFKGYYKAGQLDDYLHLDWRPYFPKLLREL